VEVKTLSEQKPQACAKALTQGAIIGPELTFRGRDSADNDVEVAGVWSGSKPKGITILLKAAPGMSNEKIGRLEFPNEPRGGRNKELVDALIGVERNHRSIPMYPVAVARVKNKLRPTRVFTALPSPLGLWGRLLPLTAEAPILSAWRTY